MATQAAFYQEALAELWRTDDTDLLAAMPNIVQRANARLRRDIQLYSQATVATLVFLDNQAALPPNRQQLKAVLRNYGQDTQARLHYVEPERFLARTYWADRYTIVGGELLAYCPDGENLTVIYYGGLDPIFDTEEGLLDGFQARHPDFYLACVCYYASQYLRDGESATFHENAYMKMKEDVIAYERNLLIGDTGFDAPLPGVVA